MRWGITLATICSVLSIFIMLRLFKLESYQLEDNSERFEVYSGYYVQMPPDEEAMVFGGSTSSITLIANSFEISARETTPPLGIRSDQYFTYGPITVTGIISVEGGFGELIFLTPLKGDVLVAPTVEEQQALNRIVIFGVPILWFLIVLAIVFDKLAKKGKVVVS